MFDDAVLTFGLHVEGKLAETDRQGRHVNRIEDVLRDEDTPRTKTDNAASFAKLAQMAGVKVL